MGSNDIRDAFVAFQSGGFPAALAILQKAVDSIELNTQVLHQAGARSFLVWLPPNVGLTPAIGTLGPGAAQLAMFLTQTFNGLLSGKLTTLSALPGISIAPLNTYALLNNIVANPQAYGLTNTSQACVTPFDAPFFCQIPDEYLFWDGIHPTRAAHTIVAQTAASVLGL